MKRALYTIATLFFVVSIFFASPYIVLADEGEEGGHGLEVEAHGYHVILANESEWTKGENTVVVTLADEMGMPVMDAEVEILIAPKSVGHSESEAETQASESQGHDAMSGMDMGAATEEVDTHESSAHEAPAHAEEEVDPVSMRETDEPGVYVAELHMENVGGQSVLVMFHVNGEMIEATFDVTIPGTNSKTVTLWSFVLINTGLIASAGFMKKQSIAVKGEK